MKEAMSLNKPSRKNKPIEEMDNEVDNRKYSDVVKGGSRTKEDFQYTKIPQDTSQTMEELMMYMKTIAEKVETLMMERHYFQQWSWAPESQYQNQNFQH